MGIKYHLKSVSDNSEELKFLLGHGYEPFAISHGGVKIWLKRAYSEGRGRPKKNKTK